MEDWQRKVVDDKMRDRASRNTSKELLATYSGAGAIKEEDLKLKVMREEHRKKQREAKHAMAKYKKKELSQDDIKLRALREEQRRLHEDAERAMHNYKKTELSEDDIKLRALREEDRKKQQDAEKMWRTFQNNDVKSKKRAVRQDVTHPPVESMEVEDVLANITAGSVSELAAALKHASPPRKVENTRTKSRRPGDADYPSGTNMAYSYDEGDDEDHTDLNESATSWIADPCDSPRRGAVAAAAAHFSGTSTGMGDYSNYSQRSSTDYASRSGAASASAADQSTEHTDYDFSANQDEEGKVPASETTNETKPAEEEAPSSNEESSSQSAANDDDQNSATDAKEDDEEPPSESQAVEESEHEPSENPVEEEPTVVPSNQLEAEEAGPAASENNVDDSEIAEQAVEQEPTVVVSEKEEEPVVEPVVEVVEKEEPIVEPEPTVEPAVVENNELAVEESHQEPTSIAEPPVNEPAPDVKEEPVVPVVEAEPAKEEDPMMPEPAPVVVVAEEEPTKEPEKSEKEAPEKPVPELKTVKKQPKRKSNKVQVPVQPAAYTQPSEDSKVVQRAQYIDAQSGEEKKLEVNDDILHVLDDAEETKPLVGQTSKVRLDVLFSFGLLTTSKKPSFTNYLLAVEDIVQRTLVDKPDIAKYVSYDKEFGPFVQEYNKDDTYVDPKGRDHVRRVVVIAAIPVFLSNGISIRTARESICAGLQGAIVSGEFVYLAKTTFNQKKQKQ